MLWPSVLLRYISSSGCLNRCHAGGLIYCSPSAMKIIEHVENHHCSCQSYRHHCRNCHSYHHLRSLIIFIFINYYHHRSIPIAINDHYYDSPVTIIATFLVSLMLASASIIKTNLSLSSSNPPEICSKYAYLYSLEGAQIVIFHPSRCLCSYFLWHYASMRLVTSNSPSSP